jgi:hypothetical protein
MGSDNPSGAGNQQGSLEVGPVPISSIPQRLHAELLETDASGLSAYLQGALRDGTRSRLHATHRIGQSDPVWLALLREILNRLHCRGWIYREGRLRSYWVLETTASFLSIDFDGFSLVGTRQGLDYVRGYFDAEGGMPQDPKARLYLGISQKNRQSLEAVRMILESWEIDCGRIHNPSQSVDPDYWRFYIRSESHRRFMAVVGSWHPRKRLLVEARMKI